MKKRLIRWSMATLWTLIPLLGPAMVAADEKSLTYDRISLSAAVEREVANDMLTAVLYMQREGDDAGQLAGEVNRSIQWSTTQAQAFDSVRLQTLDYRTQPIYNKQHLSGWRVRQSIRLESADTSALSDLVGILQKRLAVENIVYKLSPQRRRQVENELIGESIDAFRERAQLVAKRFGRSAFRLVDVNVDTSSDAPRARYRGAVMSMQADAAPPPAFKPGTQTVRIHVNGTVELKLE